MKRSVISIFLISAALLSFSFSSFSVMSIRAQFRAPSLNQDPADQPKPAIDAMTGTGDSFLSRLFDPARWSDHSSYNLSYTSFGGQSVSLAMYTNTISFHANDAMVFSADISAVYSPFSSLGSAYSKSLSGIYISDARLDWKLGEHTSLMIQYIGGPGPNTMPYYYLPRF